MFPGKLIRTEVMQGLKDEWEWHGMPDRNVVLIALDKNVVFVLDVWQVNPSKHV